MSRSVGEAMEEEGRRKDLVIRCVLGGKKTFFLSVYNYNLCQFILRMLQSAE